MKLHTYLKKPIVTSMSKLKKAVHAYQQVWGFQKSR